MNKEKYLKTLDIDDLFNLYEDIIRHSHYCPCECHCFDNWKFRYDKYEVRDQILVSHLE